MSRKIRNTTPSRSKKSVRSSNHPQQRNLFRFKNLKIFSLSKTSKRRKSKSSLNNQLDIVGVIFTLVGLLLLMGMVSAPQSSLIGEFIGFIIIGLGWAGYLLPFILLLSGLWLILRKFNKIPNISLERTIGLILLYTCLLGFLHLFSFPKNYQAAYSLAQSGKGGGYCGAIILVTLQKAFGSGGTSIALIAWLVISLTLTIEIPVSGLFQWIPRFISYLQDIWDEYQSKKNRQKTNIKPVATSNAILPSKETQSFRPIADKIAPSYITQPQATISWKLPRTEDILLPGNQIKIDHEQDQQRARVIEETLASFNAPGKVVEIKRGPTITLFGVEPDYLETRGSKMRVRVSKITGLADDLALALAARTIRIQAPVPGKGYVGIEVPNDEISIVSLQDVVESDAFKRIKSPLRFAVGEDVSGNAVAADLAAMPHLLIAGTTGSGKSVCVNALISCLLLHNTPDVLRLIMVDPKRVELTNYNGIPHLLAPVVVELERVLGALQWITREMDQRYHKLAQAGSRNITEFNAHTKENGQKELPHLVVFIDELADLMMLAPDETERTITRLAQLARATGIHLVIATQRPSVDVVTGLIKANFPARIAFAVASGVDSRVILDQPGAERLLGRGDMLFQAPDAPAPVRLQGTYISDAEIQRLVDYWRQYSDMIKSTSPIEGGVIDDLPTGVPLKQMPLWDDMKEDIDQDPLLIEAIDLVRRKGRASISMLQRHFRIGYTRAARLVESMEEKGIVGSPLPGTGAREVLDYGQTAPPQEA